jgi:flagellin
VVGSTTYTFGNAASITANAAANTVLIGSDAASSMQNLSDAINGTASVSGTEYTAKTAANTQVNASATGNDVTVSAKAAVDNGIGVSATSGAISTLNGAATITTPTSASLLSTTTAADALTKLTAAIDTVAAQRGTLGAAINQLTSATNVMNTQVQNLQSAENSVMNADIGKTVANMTQYNVLQSTGMAALQQSNQAQQAVLKLVQ